MTEPSTWKIVGVVTPGGAAGVRLKPSTDWTLRFSLRPWRHESDALNDTELVITKVVSDVELRETRSRIKPYDVLEVAIAPELSVGEPKWHASLVRVIGPGSDDADLEAAAKELQKPVYLEGGQFGRLRLIRGLDSYYEGVARWGTHLVTLHLHLDDGMSGTAPSALAVAHSLWRDQATWTTRLQDRAIDKLLSLKNESWLEEDEAPITPDEFRSRLTLKNVAVYSGGGFAFTYDDGDLFWGHAIGVHGTLIDGATDSVLQG